MGQVADGRCDGPGHPRPVRRKLRRHPGSAGRPGGHRRRPQSGRRGTIGAERARTTLARAEKALKARTDDDAVARARALANLRLGEPAKSLADWTALLAKEKDDTDALAHDAIALAALGRSETARADLERLEKANAPDHLRRFAALVVAAERGEGLDAAIEGIEQALKKDPDESGPALAALAVAALASAA